MDWTVSVLFMCRAVAVQTPVNIETHVYMYEDL